MAHQLNAALSQPPCLGGIKQLLLAHQQQRGFFEGSHEPGLAGEFEISVQNDTSGASPGPSVSGGQPWIIVPDRSHGGKHRIDSAAFPVDHSATGRRADPLADTFGIGEVAVLRLRPFKHDPRAAAEDPRAAAVDW